MRRETFKFPYALPHISRSHGLTFLAITERSDRAYQTVRTIKVHAGITRGTIFFLARGGELHCSVNNVAADFRFNPLVDCLELNESVREHK